MRIEIDTVNKTIKVKEINPNMGELMTELMELLPDWADYKIVSVGIEITPPITIPSEPFTPSWPPNTTPWVTPNTTPRTGDFWYNSGPTEITTQDVLEAEDAWDYGDIL